MFQQYYKSTEKDDRHFNHPIDSNTGLVAEDRRPFAPINLVSCCAKVANIQGMNRKQKKKCEVNLDKENIQPLRRCENFILLSKNRCEKEFESEERKIVKPTLNDNVGQSDSTPGDSILNGQKINPELIAYVYLHMKEMESKTTPLFRSSECKISKELRSSMINYLIYTSEKFNLDTETFHLAANYLDRFLSKEVVEVSELLLVAIGSILVAWKYEESRDKVPDMKALVMHLSGAFGKREILQMEQRILRALNFQVSYPTAYHFLQIFCDICEVQKEDSFLPQCICDISLIYEDICFMTEPSRIAAASLLLSNCLLGIQPTFGELSILSHYEVKDLKFTARLLFSKFAEILCTQFEALKAKYGSMKYHCILKYSYPNDRLFLLF